MKKIKQKFFAILLMLFIGSCSYESAVPIDQPTVKGDPSLLGSWTGESTGELGEQRGRSGTWTLTRQDEFLYTIKIKKSGQTDEASMTGFLSMVKGEIFMNVYDDIPKGSPRGYYIYKLVKVDANTIKLYPLTENIRERFTSSRELRKFIEDNMMNSYFFDKPYLCSRKPDK